MLLISTFRGICRKKSHFSIVYNYETYIAHINFFYRSLMSSRKKGDEGSVKDVEFDNNDKFASRPERGYYEILCRREKNLVVSWLFVAE